MWPVLSRHLVFPLHERLLKRKTLAYLRELEYSQWCSPDELRELQRVKLGALLQHAASKTPFYRKRLADAGVNPGADDSFDALDRLPLLTKEEIRASVDDMLWRGSPGGLHRLDTGGSTGAPLTFYVDRRRQAYDQAARLRTHRWFGVQPGDREAYLWGSPVELSRTNRLRRLRDALLNHRLLDAFRMSPARMDAYLFELEQFRPACLFGYPSSLSLLAQHARTRKRSLHLSTLRAVFVTGEVCYPHHRETIESFYGVPVADGYGSRDAGFIAHECPCGTLHVTAENVILEVVANGKPVPGGETGEIVITHLDAYAMPFIRYRTGDIGRLKPGRCACGRGLCQMDIVQGRSTDFLYLPDGSIKHALSIIYPLRALRGVSQFRVTQHEDYGVTIDVVCDDRLARVTREAVAGCVRPVLGDAPGLTVHMVDHIASADSGKHRYVVSHAKPAGDRVEPEGAYP